MICLPIPVFRTDPDIVCGFNVFLPHDAIFLLPSLPARILLSSLLSFDIVVCSKGHNPSFLPTSKTPELQCIDLSTPSIYFTCYHWVDIHVPPQTLRYLRTHIHLCISSLTQYFIRTHYLQKEGRRGGRMREKKLGRKKQRKKEILREMQP